MGWLTGDTPEMPTFIWAEDAMGRRLDCSVERREREDVRAAVFPEDTGGLFGFRICFAVAEGTAFFLCLSDGERTNRCRTDTRRVSATGRIPDSRKAQLKETWRSLIKKDSPEGKPVVSPYGDTDRQTASSESRKGSTPLFSIVIPACNTQGEHLADMLESVMGQTYDSWEICLADGSARSLRESCEEDQSLLGRTLAGYLTDPRVRYRHLPSNLGISGNSNEALAMACGEYTVMLDHDDILTPDALACVAGMLAKRPEADFIYSDSDLTDHDYLYCYNPLFKPEWSPQMLYSANYITHLSVIRTDLLRELGGFRSSCDGAQDWDLFLRVGERTDRIYRIPRILYHWRAAEGSTARGVEEKPYARRAQLASVQGHLDRMGIAGRAVFEDRAGTCIRVELSAREHRGDVVLCTAPGVILSEEAAAELRAWAGVPGIGVVCPRVADEKGRIVSQGVLLCGDGPEALFAGSYPGTANALGHTDWYRNHVAAEPFCYAVSRQAWEEVGPPDEKLGPLAMVDFCLRMEEAGYRTLMTPFAQVTGEQSIAQAIRKEALAAYKKRIKRYQAEERR